MSKHLEDPNRRANLDAPQVDKSQYGHSYDTIERLASYWHQVDEVLQFSPDTVLEIGTGSGYTRRLLQSEGVRVLSLDVAADLNPDILGSVRAIPFRSNSVDVSACFQVLEHLPFAEFESAVRELFRVSRKAVIISLPDRERYFRLSLAAWNRFRNYLWEVPRSVRRRPYILDPQHFWEIGQGPIGRKDVETAIVLATGVFPETYRVFQNPYHRFFIIKK